ncbi:MAG: hypothetical protein AAF640_10840, partial [Pseudomonadota bacterium]
MLTQHPRGDKEPVPRDSADAILRAPDFRDLTQGVFTLSQSFYPPQRTLMGPGPSDVSPRVLGALGRPTIGHLDPLFVELMDEIKGLLQYAFQTENELTLPV